MLFTVSLKPIRNYNNSQMIHSQRKQDNVFMLDQFTLSDKQVLLIEVNEKNGVRNQVLRVKSSDIIKLKNIDSLKLY